MENTYKFFENKQCKYYPCHKGMQSINCLFCYCPLYNLAKCPGEYRYVESKGKRVKDCADCTFPHKTENYDIIITLLSKQ